MRSGGELLRDVHPGRGFTPLFSACQAGHVAIVEFLLEAGGPALARHRLADGYTCLHNVCETGKVDVIRALLRAATASG